MEKKSSERVVEVEWEDSSLRHGWQDRDGLDQRVARCVTRGVVERDDDEGMLILFQTAQYADGRGYCCSAFIPRSAVRKVTELGPKRR